MGLGYLEVSLAEANPQVSENYRVRARDILRTVTERGLDDPVVNAALARIHERENPPMSIQLAESVLRSTTPPADARTEALFALSNAYKNLKRLELAIQPLEQLVELRRQAGDWFLLGVCKYQAGDINGALLAAQQAVEIRPDLPRFRDLLAELQAQSGKNDLAAEQREVSRRLTAALGSKR